MRSSILGLRAMLTLSLSAGAVWASERNEFPGDGLKSMRSFHGSFKNKRSGKVFAAIGDKQAERNKRQGLRNVNVNGFSLIQRG